MDTPDRQTGRPHTRWLLAWEMGSGLGHWAGLTAVASQALARGIEPVMVVPTLAPSGLRAPEGARLIACPPMVQQGNAPGGTSSMTELLATQGFGNSQTLEPPLRAWRDLITLLQPDAVIADHAPGALAVAQALAVPAVQLGTGFACPPANEARLPSFRTWETPDGLAMTRAEINVSQALAAVSRALDLPRLPQSAAAIYRTPAVLRTLPGLDHYPARPPGARYCGPLEVASDEGSTGTAPAWPEDTVAAERSRRKRVLVYVKADHPHAVMIMQALAGRPDVFVHAYIANVGTINNVAKNIAVHPKPLPLKSMLPEADLLIHHGGAGATSQALLAGVPQLLLPQMAEQFLTGRLLENLAAGQLLWGNQDGNAIAQALHQALQSAALRDGARKAAADHAQFGGDNAARALQMIDESLRSPTL